jgi:hypothetical protein
MYRKAFLDKQIKCVECFISLESLHQFSKKHGFKCCQNTTIWIEQSFMILKLLYMPITLLKSYIVFSTESINKINRNPNTSYAQPSASLKMRPFHQMPSTSLGQQNMTQILSG